MSNQNSLEAFNQPYQQLGSDFYRPCQPEALLSAQWVACNQTLLNAHDIQLPKPQLLALASGQLDEYFNPIAQKYTGHQFGYYNPDLGDGRGLLLGQGSSCDGLTYDWHLKGAGRTPFSRGGDGRAVLRSCIREYLASEALYGLGIPTSRALSVVTNNETVWREGPEPRAALLRLTPSHIRFGHFEWADQLGAQASRRLADYVLAQHYPQFLDAADPYASLLAEIINRTARLIAQWQSVGFNHGVMNTDNFSILGETFDFGPYAFFDDCDIGFICNHSDQGGRYAYNEQPQVGLWNCQVLVESFRNLVPNATTRSTVLNHYVTTYNQAYLSIMRAKLGLKQDQQDDKNLVAEFIILMDKYKLDWTLSWRELALPYEQQTAANLPDYQAWWSQYQARLDLEGGQEAERIARINQHNPLLVLRNFIAQEAIYNAGIGQTDWVDALRNALLNPYEVADPWLSYCQRPTAQQKGLRLSCSS